MPLRPHHLEPHAQKETRPEAKDRPPRRHAEVILRIIDHGQKQNAKPQRAAISPRNARMKNVVSEVMSRDVNPQKGVLKCAMGAMDAMAARNMAQSIAPTCTVKVRLLHAATLLLGMIKATHRHAAQSIAPTCTARVRLRHRHGVIMVLVAPKCAVAIETTDTVVLITNTKRTAPSVITDPADTKSGLRIMDAARGNTLAVTSQTTSLMTGIVQKHAACLRPRIAVHVLTKSVTCQSVAHAARLFSQSLDDLQKRAGDEAQTVTSHHRFMRCRQRLAMTSKDFPQSPVNRTLKADDRRHFFTGR